MKSFIDLFTDARAVSTPLVAVKTFDPQSSIHAITKSLGSQELQDLTPLISWDAIRGLRGLNDKGVAEVAAACNAHGTPRDATVDLSIALGTCESIPEDALIFIHNPQLVWESDKKVIQAVWNLRNDYKANSNMLVLLIGVGDQLPIELQQDVLILEEPLPTRDELAVIVKDSFEDAAKSKPAYKACKTGATVEVVRQAVDALIGLPTFPADQSTARSLDRIKGVLDLDTLWSQKRSIVSQNRGLTYEPNLPTLADKYGVESATKFAVQLMNGKHRPTLILRLDEMEKQFAGNGTDSSGSTGKLMSEFLNWVNDRKIICSLNLGVQGTSKSWLPFCIGGEYKVPIINYNVAAMEDKHVGEGARFMRNANRTIDAISDGRVWLVATANSLNGLPPELINRFQVGGIFFFDIPDATEQKEIMKLKMKKYGLDEQPLPDMTNWTGRDIDSCARKADLLGVSLVDAGKYIVPLMTSHRDQLEGLRESAHGRFLSASHEGVYQYVKATETTKTLAPIVREGRKFR